MTTGRVAELADATDSKSVEATRVGSSPTSATISFYYKENNNVKQ